MLGPKERLADSKELFDWRRGGAESYICAAQLRVATEKGLIESRQYILKAVLSFGPSSTGRVGDLVSRYKILESTGVPVPRTYYAGQGVLLQDFIAFSLPDYLRKIEGDDVALLEVQRRVLTISRKLDELRFAPVSFVPDLRVTTEGEVLIVDVGEDLGSPGQAPEGSRMAQERATNALGALIAG